MNVKAIINSKLIVHGKIIKGKVLIFDNRIIDIIDEREFYQDEIKNKIEIIDARGDFVSPGFIDIHIHGIKGVDVMDGNEGDIEFISKEVLKSGVTSFLPTTMTMTMDRINKALDNIRNSMNSSGLGARILGAHLEGPFISKKYKGAQDEKYILPPKIEYIEGNLDIIKLITLAPEEDKEYNFIKDIKKRKNITLSMGHTGATYEEAMKAVDEGINSATHCFNGMTGLHHRDPGTVGAVMNSNIYCEIIADTIHLHPSLYNIMGKIKGVDKLILITDAIRATSMKPGIYDLGGQDVQVENGRATLVSNGSLAGSTLQLNKAVRNMLYYSSYNLEEIIKMVTENPAKAIGIDKERGSIEKNLYADIIIFNEEMDINLVLVEGNICYRSH